MNRGQIVEMLGTLHEAGLIPEPNDVTLRVWGRVMAKARYEDVMTVVFELVEHRTSKDWRVTPGDILTRVKAIRRERIHRAGGDPLPPVDPNEVIDYQAARVAALNAIASGATAAEARRAALDAVAVRPQITRRPTA